jgi:hypothetical protein
MEFDIGMRRPNQPYRLGGFTAMGLNLYRALNCDRLYSEYYYYLCGHYLGVTRKRLFPRSRGTYPVVMISGSERNTKGIIPVRRSRRDGMA